MQQQTLSHASNHSVTVAQIFLRQDDEVLSSRMGRPLPSSESKGTKRKSSKSSKSNKKLRQDQTRRNHLQQLATGQHGDGGKEGKPKRKTRLSTAAADARPEFIRKYCPANSSTGEFYTVKDGPDLWDNRFETYAAKCTWELHMATYLTEPNKKAYTLKQVTAMNRE